MSKHSLIGICAACVVAGYLVAVTPGFNPVNPFKPEKQRPVLQFLMRVAKFGLWLTVLAEPPATNPERQYEMRVGGCEGICHREGW